MYIVTDFYKPEFGSEFQNQIIGEIGERLGKITVVPNPDIILFETLPPLQISIRFQKDDERVRVFVADGLTGCVDNPAQAIEIADEKIAFLIKRCMSDYSNYMEEK